jgi:hypothetical protein
MPETTDSPSREASAAGAAEGSGCVIFLVDESIAMDARVAGGTKSKAQSIATALNSLLGQLTSGPAVDVAVVGYRAAAPGEPEVGPRWQGALAGRRFVSSADLADAPLAVENRVRKVPGSGGVGVAREESVPFPVWYVPKLGGTAPRAGAFDQCGKMISTWLSGADPARKPPMVVSFLGEVHSQDTPENLGGALQEIDTPAGPPLVIHAHLSSSDRIPATLYPSTDAHLPPGPISAAFQASSALPEPLCASLRELQVTLNAGARGLVYNAKMVDLIRLLSLVRTYAEYQPAEETAPPADEEASAASAASSAESAPGADEQAVLLVLLLDRSVEDPASDESQNVWHRLQDHANDLLGQVSTRAKGTIHTAVVSCGTDAAGGPLVQTTFGGALAGRAVVPDTDLPAGALRVEDVSRQVSNGIGGLVQVTRKRPVFVELEPTVPVDPKPGFAAVKDLVTRWQADHPSSIVSPIVLHLTRGRFEPSRINEAVGQLHDLGNVGLYHLIVTESPHPSLAYVADPEKTQSAELRKLWELSSPLQGRQTLSEKGPAVSPDSRGIVINGKFDLLMDAIHEALKPADPEPSDSPNL